MEELIPFPVCISVYSRTFTFSVQFLGVRETPLLKAFSLLFLGACDRIPHVLSLRTWLVESLQAEQNC